MTEDEKRNIRVGFINDHCDDELEIVHTTVRYGPPPEEKPYLEVGIGELPSTYKDLEVKLVTSGMFYIAVGDRNADSIS